MEVINRKNEIVNETKEEIIENILKNSIIKNTESILDDENENDEKENIIKDIEDIGDKNENEIKTAKFLKIDNSEINNIYNNKEINKENEEEKDEYETSIITNSKQNKINEDNNENYDSNINLEQNEKEESEYITCLENLRGLLGQKFKYERIETYKYKPWEFVTLKSKLFLNLFQNSEKRKKLIELSFHCMMKAYPQKFNSDNYDIIKCWCCGCQTAAVNIQAVQDDFTLFNQIFFTQNNNCGYVLKPKKYLLDTFEFENYDKPKYFLKIQILELFNFIKLAEIADIKRKKNAKMFLKIYSLGPYTENDGINNKKYKNEYIFDIIGGLLTPSILNNQKIKIPVYEEKLGGIMIKFFYEKEIIGRGCIPYCLMKMGYRKIPIYDNNSVVRESIFVVGCFEKTF